MVTTNLDNCMEVKDGALRFKRGLYETIDQEGICFYGTAEELKPLEEALFGNQTDRRINRIREFINYG